MLIIWGGRDRWLPVACWPVSLAKSASGKPVESHVSKKKVESVSEMTPEATFYTLMCRTYTCMQIPTHKCILTQTSTHMTMHTQVCM